MILIKRMSINSVKLVRESGRLYDVDSWIIKNPEDAYNMFKTIFKTDEMTTEHFMMFVTDTQNKVVDSSILFKGTLNSSVVHPREVFQRALLANGSSVFVAHNHPSGNVSPSQEDINVTRRLKECGKIMGIAVLDHIVLGLDGFTSLTEYMNEKCIS